MRDTRRDLAFRVLEVLNPRAETNCVDSYYAGKVEGLLEAFAVLGYDMDLARMYFEREAWVQLLRTMREYTSPFPTPMDD